MLKALSSRYLNIFLLFLFLPQEGSYTFAFDQKQLILFYLVYIFHFICFSKLLINHLLLLNYFYILTLGKKYKFDISLNVLILFP